MANEETIDFKYRKALAMDMIENPHKYRLDSKTMKLWDEAARESRGMGPDYDYSGLGSIDDFGHGSDKGKLYTHPTFSNQSMYANKKFPGGTWGLEERLPSEIMVGDTNPPKIDTFRPSQRQLANIEGLKRYINWSNKHHKDSGHGYNQQVRLVGLE